MKIKQHQAPWSAVIRRAVQAWNAGRPHQAWEILTTAGYGDQWPRFQAIALRQARARYGARMRAYRVR